MEEREKFVEEEQHNSTNVLREMKNSYCGGEGVEVRYYRTYTTDREVGGATVDVIQQRTFWLSLMNYTTEGYNFINSTYIVDKNIGGIIIH